MRKDYFSTIAGECQEGIKSSYKGTGEVEKKEEGKMFFTVHRVHGRPVGLAEIGGDMRGAVLESPARSLRCSEGVIGRLLFLFPPPPLLP